MKKRTLTILLLLLVVGVWIWWHHNRPADQVTTESPAVETNQPASSPLTQPQRSQTSARPAPTGVSGPTPESDPAAWIEKRRKQIEEETQRGLNEWRTPIEFYGKIVDDRGNPVFGAQIGFSCNDLSPEGTSTYHAVSDADGSFSLNNVTGKLLVVRISKEGYYTSKRDNDSFTYAGENVNFVPDAANPIVFHLRKKGKAEPLIATDFPVGMGQIAQLRHDGIPVELDLFKGEKVAAGSGQLQLEFWRDVSEKNARIFDWKCQLSVPGGGLVETPEEFVFQAPESGYKPSLVIDMPATNQNWQGEIRSKYYIRLPDGKYGRIECYLLPWNGVFTIQSAVNPSGSRNLEFDPNNAINP